MLQRTSLRAVPDQDDLGLWKGSRRADEDVHLLVYMQVDEEEDPRERNRRHRGVRRRVLEVVRHDT